METSDLAMVSRIRVEVRGGSMEAAERVAVMVLDHARMAGVLEGVVPGEGEWTDHFFHYPQMTRKPGEPADPWSELGLQYAGRVAFTFEPQVVRGGVRASGFEVTEVRDYTPHGLAGHERSTVEPIRSDVTDKVIVLLRVNEATRDHIWETVPESEAVEATAEEILDNIRRLVNVDHVETQTASGGGWIVMVDLNGEGVTDSSVRSEAKPTLREAALDAYERCGVEVTHYDTRLASESLRDERSVEMSVAAELGVPTLFRALLHLPYRTLLVGSEDAFARALVAVADLRKETTATVAMSSRARALSVHQVDRDPDTFVLSTESYEALYPEAAALIEAREVNATYRLSD